MSIIDFNSFKNKKDFPNGFTNISIDLKDPDSYKNFKDYCKGLDPNICFDIYATMKYSFWFIRDLDENNGQIEYASEETKWVTEIITKEDPRYLILIKSLQVSPICNSLIKVGKIMAELENK